MRPLLLGGSVVLAACTLLVPIDDDVTDDPLPDGGPVEAGTSSGGKADANLLAVVDAPSDSGEPMGPPRDGCPYGVALDPDLEGYYPFDETGGTVLHDCSQKARDLPAIASAPTWTAGQIHGAGDFNAADGCCFASNDPELYRFEGKPFSISVWFFARQLFDATNKTGLWIIGHKTSPRGWHFGVDDPNRVELDLEWIPNATNKKTEISAISELSTWTHIAATYSPDGQGAIYKNGVLVEKQSGTDKVPATFDTGTNVLLRVGCRNATSGTFDGKVDELRVYAGVLDEAKIRRLAAR